MKKFLNSLLLFFLVSSGMVAQTYLGYIVESTRNADLVVEGQVESAEAYQAENGRVLTRNFLFVRQALKGNWIQGEQVIVETPGGKVGGTEDICFHCTELKPDEKGIFFLKASEGRHTLLNGNAGKVRRLNIDEMKHGVIPSLREYVPDWKMLLNGIKRVAGGEVITQADLEPADNEICFKIDSIEIIDERHVSARVYAKSDTPNMKFGGAEISVKYPTSIMGSYLVQNGLLVSTAGNFVSNNNVYGISQVDISEDEFKLSIGSNCTDSLAYATLGTSYEEIAELILEVDIAQASGLVENSEITDAKGKYYDPVANDCVDYRRVCLDGELFVASCSNMEVEIIGVAGAGIGSMVKITGEGFGDDPGKIKIPDADTDMDDGVVLENIDETLLSWSDDLIELNITAISPPGIMGSGDWKVDPAGLLNFACKDEVNIDFSLQKATVTDTDENGNEIELSKHVRRYSLNSLQGAVSYYLDNTINSNPELSSQGLSFNDVELLVKQVLCEWESKTGISLNYLGAIDPNLQTNSDDAKNVIYFADAATIQTESMGTHTAAFTTMTAITFPGCTEVFEGNPNDFSIRYPYSIDSRIAINEENNWYDKNSGTSIGSNQFDLFTVLLHEIGHSLGLNHALDPDNNGADDTRAMYPDVENNNDSKHAIDNGDEAGGMFIAQKSRELLQSPDLLTAVCKNDFSLNDEKFCTTTSVHNSLGITNTFEAFPTICSPNQEVFIKNEFARPLDFIVLNSLGIKVNSFRLANESKTVQKFQHKGVYFISAFIEGRIFTQKIIVQ